MNDTVKHNGKHKGENKHYMGLLGMVVLSFISMYVLMYAMVNSFENVYTNHNQLYMAGLMTAPMIAIEMWLMRHMYANKKLNAFIVVGSVVSLVGFFTLIRQQTGISEKQFFKSMIPHHAGAILMCEQSSAKSPTIRELCKNIITSQQAEIEQMKTLLKELED